LEVAHLEVLFGIRVLVGEKIWRSTESADGAGTRRSSEVQRHIVEEGV
jgi:hypothetical protein